MKLYYARMWQSPFLPTDRVTDIFFISQLLKSISLLGQHYSKMNFCDIRAMILLQSYVIMPGGNLPETENKRMCQISGPKSGRSRLRNLCSGSLGESFWNSVWLRNKTVICKVAAYGRWSLTRGGRYERVDCSCYLLEFAFIGTIMKSWSPLLKSSNSLENFNQ